MARHSKPVRAVTSMMLGLAIAVTTVSTFSALPTEGAHAGPAVTILPTPQQQSSQGVPFPLSGTVNVVVGARTDPAARALLGQVITKAGGTASFRRTPPTGRSAIYLGTSEDNATVKSALGAIGVADASRLTAEGYVIGSGTIAHHPALVLSGRDRAGTYYAVQSLSQTVVDGVVPPVRVRDWPLMASRGVIEGFYGIPWTDKQIRDQLAFYGNHKLNTFVYAPKDDPNIRSGWRQPYSETELANLKMLVEQASAHHVDFSYELAPSSDVCYSSQADLDAALAKFAQLRSIGITSFSVGLDDIPTQLNCPNDTARFVSPNDDGDHAAAVAEAQSYFLNQVVSDFIQPNGLTPLRMVPTDYAGTDTTPYRAALGANLDESVGIEWTGTGVFADTTTVKSAKKAAHSYQADHFFLWDNFPVNDGQPDRLFLNPLQGRDPLLSSTVEGIVSNPMAQPYASMIALSEYGDYDWNGPKYNAAASQDAAITELAGPDDSVRAALAAFVDLNQNWQPYRSDSQNAPALSADIRDFWSGYHAGDQSRMRPLENRLDILSTLPQTLSRMSEVGFSSDAAPWISAASHWAKSLRHEVAMLEAIRGNDGVTATDAGIAALAEKDLAGKASVPDLEPDGTVTANAISPTVGDGRFEIFVAQAMREYDSWLGAAPAAYPATAMSDLSTYDGHTAKNMSDNNLDTWYSSADAPLAGNALTVDLGSAQPIGSVLVHQSTSDTDPGDMVYHALIQYSVNGSTWIDADSFDAAPLITQTFASPVVARYVRLIATAPNPNNQWVRIREFDVSGPLSEMHSTLAGRPGHSAENAFDASLATSFAAAQKPGPGSLLIRGFSDPRPVRSIAVVGHAAGRVQVETTTGWQSVGSLDPKLGFQQFAVSATRISAARLEFTPGSTAPVVNELVLRRTSIQVATPSMAPILIAFAVVLCLAVVIGAIVWNRRTRRRTPRRRTLRS